MADPARAVLDIQGWRDDLSMYAVLLGHFAARRDGRQDEARNLLDEAVVKCDPSAWPYPIIRHLRGELDEAGLLAAAVDGGQRARPVVTSAWRPWRMAKATPRSSTSAG